VGSSMAAYVSLGVYKDYPEAIRAMVRIRDTYLPDMTEHEVYKKLFGEVYAQVFDSLSPLYRRLNGIIKHRTQ